MANHRGWSKTHWAALAVTMAAVGLLLSWLISTAIGNHDDAQENAGRLETAQDQIDALAEQVERLGGNPVVEPSEAPEPVEGTEGEQGEQGPPGPQGEPGPAPSPDDVEEAVRRYCAITNCQGPPGDVTADQVAAAVALYCDARGECSGPTGEEGPEGPVGPEGPAPTADQIARAVSDYCATHDSCAGPQGAGPTDAQIARAVNDYCAAHDLCAGPKGPAGDRGPQGPPGPPGEPGAPGEDAFPFTFTFTIPADGILDQDHTYSCRVDNPEATAVCQEAG